MSPRTGRQHKPRNRSHRAPRSGGSQSRQRFGKLFGDLVALQARLRSPGGCPWDREQTHDSLRTYLLEETYEVLDAIDAGDPGKLTGELGDLLLQIVFHAQLAREAGKFDIGDVIGAIYRKMVRRHPHVFGSAKAETPREVLKNWEELKTEERQAHRRESGGARPSRTTGRSRRWVRPIEAGVANGRSILDGVPRTWPALLEAHQLTRRAANIGFDWESVSGLLEKLEEEAAELRRALGTNHRRTRELRRRALRGPSAHGSFRGNRIEEEVGDLLFVVVNLARFLGLNPEIALKKANRKFIARLQWMEREMARQGRRLAGASREEMEALWDRSKARGRGRGGA